MVTTEFHGLFKNGGIGTANTGLATMLAGAEHEVTVAFVDHNAWATRGQDPLFLAQRAGWLEHGIFLDLIPRWSRLKATVDDFCWAVSVLEYLRARRFDVVLFNECGGQGYFALLAKRAGVFPQAPKMIVVTHGASEWARDLNAQLPASYHTAALAMFERRSVELADLVVSPSHYLVDWMRAHDWRLPAQVETLQNLVPAAIAQGAAPMATRIDEIVFFGRLESRKGVDMFCDAIAELDRAGKLGDIGVTFLGKFSRVGDVHSGVVLIERSKDWSVAPRFLVNLDQREALDYLRRPGVLAVMPSLAENSPCVVMECLIAGVPLVATSSGGTAELVAEADRELCLAAPEAGAIAAKIAQVLQRGPSRARLAQPQDDTQARWRALIARIETPAAPQASAARVSIVLSVPAHAGITPETLDALRGQTHGYVEIVIVAYGADLDQHDASRSEIRISRRSPDRAAARNAAAAAASGEWLMFARDRDQLLEPHAVAILMLAAQRLGAEAISGFAYDRRRPGRPSLDWDGELSALPYGPCLAVAALENCLGDDVFLISRRAFESLGGYESGVSPAIEDRLLLTRALVAGVKVDLAPAPLAWRRISGLGRSDEVANMRRVLAAFHDAPVALFSTVLETLVSQGPFQSRAIATARLAGLDEEARQLALQLTLQSPIGGLESFEPFMNYCLERGRLAEAVDFASRHNPLTLKPIAEAAVARQTERNVHRSLRDAVQRRPVSVSVNSEIIERLRIFTAPQSVTIERDAHCVASFALAPGLTIAKAPLACPSGAERLEAWVDFYASPEQMCEIALAVADPSAQAVAAEDGLTTSGGFWWSGWRQAERGGLRVEVANLPFSTQALDIFLMCRAPKLLTSDAAWAVWRNIMAHGTLSGLATPSGVHASEAHVRLPLHVFEGAELLTDASDFPYPVFLPGDFTLQHPLPGRTSLVRVRGAVPPGAIGIRATFSVQNENAHPVAFAFWIRQAGAPPPEEESLAEEGAASGWTICDEPLKARSAEARLSAPATTAMDLYLATKVVGFDDVSWCHAGWRELAAIESLIV